MDAIELAPGVTPNVVHLHAASDEAKQHKMQEVRNAVTGAM